MGNAKKYTTYAQSGYHLIHNPGGRLPVYMPASTETAEQHREDVADDMDIYQDECGNRYAFGFGLHY